MTDFDDEEGCAPDLVGGFSPVSVSQRQSRSEIYETHYW